MQRVTARSTAQAKTAGRSGSGEDRAARYSFAGLPSASVGVHERILKKLVDKF